MMKYSVMWASRLGGGKTSSTHTVCCCGGARRFLGRVPIEGLVKMTFTTGGIIFEQLVAHWILIDSNGHFHILGNWQHTTMHSFFLLNGFCDILIALRAPVPSGIDYATMSLACSVEGLLFFYHLHGRGTLDVHVHQLLILAIVPCVAVTGLETWNPHTVYLPMIRAALATLQGTWLWQAGFILYPPFPGHDWDLDNHENMMFVSMAFCWHILGILLFMCVVYTVVYHIYQAKEKQLGNDMELGPLSSHMLQTHSDSELD
ncbi:transmembrane protein 45B-like [Branchiostoma floridae x Branchiostoma japonicum]